MADEDRRSASSVAPSGEKPKRSEKNGINVSTPPAAPVGKAPGKVGDDFFQVVRRLEARHPDKRGLGRTLTARNDPVRLGHEPSLAFAPATIARTEPGTGDRPPRLGGAFFGLLGPNGPLPIHLTEYAYGRIHNEHDTSLSAFLDIFHHRMMSLFYRAWANSRVAVSYDNPDADPFAAYVAALFGHGQPAFRGRDAAADRAKLFFAGLLASQTRNPDGLSALLGGYFGLSVRVREFVGEWIEIPREARCRLGESARTGALGQTVVIGGRTFSARHKFRLVFGPLTLGTFESLLPGGANLPSLVALVRTYCGDEWAWDVNLVMQAEEVPTAQPGAFGRLGWTTWLHNEARGSDADDLVLNATAYTDGSGPKATTATVAS